MTFTTSRAAHIVDLDRLPDVPSLFDLSEGAIRDRPSLGFLAGFRRDVSRIEADAPAPSGWDEGKLALRLASHRPLDLTAGSAG